MKTLNKKLFLSIMTLALAFVSTIGITYAFWNVLQQESSEVITIGEGETLTLNEVLKPSGVLIPETVIAGTGEVTEAVLTYNIRVNTQSIDSGATLLNISIEDVLIGGDNTYIGLLNFTIMGDNVNLDTNDTLVTIRVTLTEPNNAIEYNNIINKDITFKVVFTVS